MSRRKLTEEERAKSLEKRRAYVRKYYRDKYHENLEESREKSRENARRWRKNNPEKMAAIQIRYNQKLLNRTTTEVQ